MTCTGCVNIILSVGSEIVTVTGAGEMPVWMASSVNMVSSPDIAGISL